jgi:hypothetical protein
MSTVKCGACGAMVEAGSEICFDCGEPMRAAAKPAAAPLRQHVTTPIREVVRSRRPDPRSDDSVRPAPPAPAAKPAGGFDLAALAAEAEAVLSGRAQPTVKREQKPTPLPALVAEKDTDREAKPTPLPALVAQSSDPPAAAKAYKKFRDDEPEAVRCPACGVPSRKERCPGCGVVLRRAD